MAKLGRSISAMPGGKMSILSRCWSTRGNLSRLESAVKFLIRAWRRTRKAERNHSQGEAEHTIRKKKMKDPRGCSGDREQQEKELGDIAFCRLDQKPSCSGKDGFWESADRSRLRLRFGYS